MSLEAWRNSWPKSRIVLTERIFLSLFLQCTSLRLCHRVIISIWNIAGISIWKLGPSWRVSWVWFVLSSQFWYNYWLMSRKQDSVTVSPSYSYFEKNVHNGFGVIFMQKIFLDVVRYNSHTRQYCSRSRPSSNQQARSRWNLSMEKTRRLNAGPEHQFTSTNLRYCVNEKFSIHG